MLLFFISWYLIGFLTLVHTFWSEWKLGRDVTYGEILIIIVGSLLGPILPFMFLLNFIKTKIESVEIGFDIDKVVIKGKKDK